MEDVKKLENELEETKTRLEEIEKQGVGVKKALWDLLNYASLFVLLLDSDMNIRLANWSLSQALGFETEKELLGKNWSEFVAPEERKVTKEIHKDISKGKVDRKKYREVVTEIISKDGTSFLVRWFNVRINSSYNMTFSFGIMKSEKEAYEENIRDYWRDVIDKDTTMIRALRDTILKASEK